MGVWVSICLFVCPAINHVIELLCVLYASVHMDLYEDGTLDK